MSIIQARAALMMAAMLGGNYAKADLPPMRSKPDDDKQPRRDAPAFYRSCPKCGVKAGEECRGPRGRYRFHGARVQV